MQQVEHKKRRGIRHGRRWILAGCAVLLIAGGVLLGITRPWERKPIFIEATPSTAGYLTNREPEEIERITVTRRGQEPWTLEKDSSGRVTVQGSELATAEVLTDLVQDAMANIGYEDILTEDPEKYQSTLADFGLDDPYLIASVRYTDGTEITLRIGDACGLEDETFHYMTVDGDDRLYAVDYGTVLDLNVGRQQLFAVEQPELRDALLDRICVLDGNGNLKVGWELQGKVTDPDAEESWIVTAPFSYPMDYDAVVSMKDNVAQLSLGAYIGPADAGRLAEYGLDAPRTELRMHFSAGTTGTVSDTGVYDVQDWEEEEFILQIGSAQSEMTDYVRWEDGIYTVSHFLLSAFLDTDPMNTVARYPILTPLDSLSSLTVESDGETVTYQVENETDGEERKCLKNGAETDPEAFDAAYERLLTVTVSGRLPEDAVTGETYKKYTFRTVSGGTHTVELSSWDSFQDAVSVDGYTLFYLAKGSMTELP